MKRSARRDLVYSILEYAAKKRMAKSTNKPMSKEQFRKAVMAERGKTSARSISDRPR